jgi:hypothetical protein
VFLAVLSVTSVGTAGVRTRALWSSGHVGHLFSFLLIISYHKGATVKQLILL